MKLSELTLQLRKDVVAAFKKYNDSAEGEARNRLFMDYCALRELFLESSCKDYGKPFIKLAMYAGFSPTIIN